MNPTALAYLYLSQNGGNTAAFRTGMLRGLRVGQAFFNALSVEDGRRLTGTEFDPYFFNDPAAVVKAIKFLDSDH